MLRDNYKVYAYLFIPIQGFNLEFYIYLHCDNLSLLISFTFIRTIYNYQNHLPLLQKITIIKIIYLYYKKITVKRIFTFILINCLNYYVYLY